MTAYGNVLLIEGRKKGPDFVAKTPTKSGRWREVGIGFFNPKTQTITISLDVAPLNGKIILFRAKVC
jgi:hypothetical protein